MRLMRETNIPFMYSPQDKLGLGLGNPGEQAMATFISEFMIHMNSNKHPFLRELMRTNYKEIGNRIGHEFLAFREMNRLG